MAQDGQNKIEFIILFRIVVSIKLNLPGHGGIHLES